MFKQKCKNRCFSPLLTLTWFHCMQQNKERGNVVIGAKKTTPGASFIILPRYAIFSPLICHLYTILNFSECN